MIALSQILNHKLVAILRGAAPADVVKIAGALYEGGIRLIEVTANSPDALSSIKQLSVQMGKQLLVGAGTILDSDAAKAAIDAGAQFIISPSVDMSVIKATKEKEVVSIPGAFTATEIVTAWNHGGDIIKVFPASVGPAYIKDLRGPLSHIPLMPTGGITLENIGEFMRTGAVAAGIGSALVNTKEKVTDSYLKQVTDKAHQFVKAVMNA